MFKSNKPKQPEYAMMNCIEWLREQIVDGCADGRSEQVSLTDSTSLVAEDLALHTLLLPHAQEAIRLSRSRNSRVRETKLRTKLAWERRLLGPLPGNRTPKKQG